MIRENRYLVLKHKDVAAYLTDEEQGLLDDLCRKINRHRLIDGKIKNRVDGVVDNPVQAGIDRTTSGAIGQP